jgi:hypothetical protein
VLGDETSGGEFEELCSRELGIERPVEIYELLHLSDGRLGESALEKAVGTSCELVLNEQFQKLQIVEAGTAGLLNSSWQGLHKAGEAQVTHLSVELRVHD